MMLFHSYYPSIPQGRVNVNIGPPLLAGLALYINTLIARTLFGSPNCAWLRVMSVLGQSIPPNHPINVVHFTKLQ